jgi:peptide/nickel transport system ATP-binding protein
MIVLDNLSVRLGQYSAVRGVSLTIRPGDRIGVVGESGCGKSMLALALMGMVPEGLEVHGSLSIDGQDMTNAPESVWTQHRARTMAMIFQEPMAALNPLRRIGDTVMEPLMVHEGLDKRAARARALMLFEETGIPDPHLRLRQYPHELSGGQRQRVLIALALACNPRLLIADEPTTALDANMALRITDLLVGLSKQRTMAMLFISHDLAAVSRATSNIVVMYGGEIVERGATDQIFKHPAHPYTQGLLAARPQIAQATGTRQRLPMIPGTVPPLTELPDGCRFAGRCPQEIPLCAKTRPHPVEIPNGSSVCCHLFEADGICVGSGAGA